MSLFHSMSCCYFCGHVPRQNLPGNIILFLNCYVNRLNRVSVHRTLADELADVLDELKDDCKESDCSSNLSDVDDSE